MNFRACATTPFTTTARQSFRDPKIPECGTPWAPAIKKWIKTMNPPNVLLELKIAKTDKESLYTRWANFTTSWGHNSSLRQYMPLSQILNEKTRSKLWTRRLENACFTWQITTRKSVKGTEQSSWREDFQICRGSRRTRRTNCYTNSMNDCLEELNQWFNYVGFRLFYCYYCGIKSIYIVFMAFYMYLHEYYCLFPQKKWLK